MERESRLASCTICPGKPGRFCTSYNGGTKRLVFNPSKQLTGAPYLEAYISPGSIEDCPFRQQPVKEIKQIPKGG